VKAGESFQRIFPTLAWINANKSEEDPKSEEEKNEQNPIGTNRWFNWRSIANKFLPKDYAFKF